MKCPKCKEQLAIVYDKDKPIKVLWDSLQFYEQSAIIGRLQVEYSKRHKIHCIKTCKKV